MSSTKVLHVEDDRIQRALVVHYLVTPNDNKYEVTSVESEDEAIEMFRQGSFDLVLLDYQLSQGDGLNCLRQLRKLDPIVPVIAVSGVATPTIAGELIEAGADDYLSKTSMDENILTESIRAVIARAEGVRTTIRAKLRAVQAR